MYLARPEHISHFGKGKMRRVMTDEEQATSIGRLAQTYSQAKAKRAALLAECGRMANVLDGVARKLRLLDIREPTFKTEPLPDSYPEKDDAFSGMPWPSIRGARCNPPPCSTGGGG